MQARPVREVIFYAKVVTVRPKVALINKANICAVPSLAAKVRLILAKSAPGLGRRSALIHSPGPLFGPPFIIVINMHFGKRQTFLPIVT